MPPENESTQTGTGSAEQTQNAGGQQAGTQLAPQQSKTFTQEQLDAIIADRLQRERKQFADYEDLKKFKETADAANKTELEKERERATKAEQKAKEVAEQTTARLLQAEARATAAELGFSKPDKAVKLIEIGDALKDGEVDSAKVKAALEALAKDMPELLGKKAPPLDPTNPGKGSAPDGKETDDQRRARLRGGGSLNDWFQSGSVTINSKLPKD